MNALKLRVRDVLGIRSAEIPLAAITLVGGLNGAGKSSLLNAAAAAALRTWMLRGAAKKADAARIVREGAESGAATLEWASGAVRVSWPSGEIDKSGDADLVEFGSAFAIGALRFMDAAKDKRQADLAARLQMAPTVEDIRAFLGMRDVPDATTLANAIFKRVDESGWDAVHKTAVDHGTKLKGRWEEVTGTAFGSAKSRDWTPKGLMKGEVYDLEAAEADLAAAKKRLSEVVAAGAITDAEFRSAETMAAKVEPVKVEVAGLSATQAELQGTLARLEGRRAELASPIGEPHPLQACPHCKKEIAVQPVAGGAPKLLKPSERRILTDEDRAEILGLDKAIAETKGSISENAAKLAQANATLMAAERSAARLAEMREAPKSDAKAVAAAEAEAARVAERRDAIKMLTRSREIYGEWLAQQPIIEALSPAGVRASVMEKKALAFNATLAQLSAIAKWSAVQITVDGDATFGGRPYALCSESERWRVDLTLQVAFAMGEQAKLMLVDRLDVLLPQHRPGAIYLIAHASIPTMVAMSAPEPEKVPNLAAKGLGRCAWVEAGAVKLL